MRTTINVDDDVFDRLMELTESRTKTEAVNRALEDYVRLKLKERLLSLSGQITIEDNYRELRDKDRYGS